MNSGGRPYSELQPHWPVPDRMTEPFWEHTARHTLAVQRCSICRKYQHPPGPVCRGCFARELDFEIVSGNGVIYSFTVTYHDFTGRKDLVLPYVVALVQLDDADGVRMLGNLLDCPVERAHVGMRVAVTFQDLSETLSLPQFVPLSIERADH